MLKLEIGDLIFINVDILPFRKVAEGTQSWTNHVGIIINDFDLTVAESTVPISRVTPLEKFVNRSKDRRFLVKRLPDLTDDHKDKIIKSAMSKMGVFYDTGFNIRSNRQFCSRFVHEILYEATSIRVGCRETLRELFHKNQNADLLFWRLWYMLNIPWDRETVTPASVLNSHELDTIFDSEFDKIN